MSKRTKMFCGIILITVPSIQYGGYFLLQVISGNYPELALTEFQEAMFRAGHAHAGVIVILSLIAEILCDHARLTKFWEWLIRVGVPLSSILISGGFFAAAIGDQLQAPNDNIALLYAGIFLLAVSVFALGVGLILSAKKD